MMTHNQEVLYNDCPPASLNYYKLRLLEFFVLHVLEKNWQITITSGWRSSEEQLTLRDSMGNLIPQSKKSKGTSQHVLGEALDFVCPNMPDCYLWIMKHIPFWQLILYLEDGKAKSIHISMPSERKEVEKKALLNVNGEWLKWQGRFPA